MTLLQISGSPTMAPIYFSNAESFPNWSGKSVTNERNEVGIFDPIFLRGYPAYWWGANYRYARRLFEAGRPNLVTEDRRMA